MHLSTIIKQKSYEHIEYSLRRHPLTFLPIASLFLILLLVPPALYFLIQNLFPDLLQGPILYPTTVLAGSVYYLSIYLFFHSHFVDFYLDLWIITNDRIVDIEQTGLFHRSVTELDLFRIQDVTTLVKGFFPTLFHYGDVIVTTASQTTGIIFRKIPNPDHIRQELIRLADGDRKYHLVNLPADES